MSWSDKRDTEREIILLDIDRATSPDKMSQSEAFDWLRALVSDIDSRIEALAEEIGEE